MAGSGSFTMGKGDSDARLDEMKKLLWSIDEHMHNCPSMEKPGVMWCKTLVQTRMQQLEAAKRAEGPVKAPSGTYPKTPSGTFPKSPSGGAWPKTQ